MSADVVKWVSGELSKLLGTDADEDVARYVLSIGTVHELEEYLGEILDASQAKNQDFIRELVRRCHLRNDPVSDVKQNGCQPASCAGIDMNSQQKKASKKGRKSKSTNQSTSSDIGNSCQPTELSASLQLPAAKSPTTESIRSSRSPKTKFVPLFSPEGHDRTVALIPGRHICECQAAKHALINNCRGCGRIVCEQEGSGPCFFCSTLVCNKEEQEMLDRNSKKSDRLRDQLMKRTSADDSSSCSGNKVVDSSGDEALLKALQHRDRLLEYDKTSAKRTHVIDDESDYFATDSNQWLRASERKALQRKETELREQRYASRLDRKVTLDFAGRQVIEERYTGDQYDENVLENGGFLDDASAAYDPTDFAFDLVNPNVKTAPPTFVVTGKTWLPTGQKQRDQQRTLEAAAVAINQLQVDRVLRLQDSELQVMSDDGMAMSMHQPWASLLVAGIKRHEGRTWYTAHRGILWIAATAKKSEPHEIATMEQFYRNYYGDDLRLSFPKSYPSGCLLGCVNVTDCLPEDAYRDQFPGGESESPYVFICENPQELTIKFPIRGKHKIYKLEKHVHQAAKNSLSHHRRAVHPAIS